MREDFAVFILTHGRADNVATTKALRKGNYTGKVYYIIDNQDKDAEKYYYNFGKDNVIMFDKEEMAKGIDTYDNFGERRVIIYARNACFDIAKKLGIKYFLQLDDDYTEFRFRYADYIKNELASGDCIRLDELFELMITFLDDTKAKTVAFSQGGDFIGGIGSRWKEKVMRKAMNTFFCKTDNKINFVGTMNEDVNIYTLLGSQGELILSITDVMINQLSTQTVKGGMTESYADSGTYVKSFYSILGCPSAVKISLMQTTNIRIHHNVNWENCVPKIISDVWKKK